MPSNGMLSNKPGEEVGGDMPALSGFSSQNMAQEMPAASMEQGTGMRDAFRQQGEGDMPTMRMERGAATQARAREAEGEMPSMTMERAGGAVPAQRARGDMPHSETIGMDKPAAKGAKGRAGAVAPKRAHVFEHPDVEIQQGSAVAAGAGAAGFDFPATLRGSTTHFHVYYDPSLGANGQVLADGVLASCEAEYNILVAYFGGVTPASFNIIIAPGVGGAYHYGCSATDLYCDASGVDVNHTRMLVVAEEVEVFEALQAKGWDCGSSNGEGLSRTLAATDLYPASLDGFNSASTWLDTAGRPDFVNVNDPTDRSYVSTGCSTLFLNYLRYQLGYKWQSIVQAAGPTLATTYKNLTGSSDALTPFKNLLQAHFPAGSPAGLKTDNPFPFQTGTEGWSGYENLGGYCIDGVAVASWDRNRLDNFVVGSDGAMYHKWWDGSSWSGWENLGGYCISAPAAVSWGPNRIDTFVIGTDHAMYHKWWNGSAWSGWENLGGYCLEGVGAASWAPNRLDCFVIGSNGAMYHKWWDGSNWSGWENQGGYAISAPSAVSWGPNRIDSFVIGTDHAMYHKWWNGAAWSGWENLGGYCLEGTASASWAPNRLDCFVIGSDGAQYHKWWNGSSWNGWENLGGYCISGPAAVSWGPNRIDTFVIGTDHAMYHKWWA